MKPLHYDPTFDAVLRSQVRERGCRVCVNRRVQRDNSLRCVKRDAFPACLPVNFKLDEGGERE